MAIVIPSKHIYNRSFDPVVDNQIDKIEINAQNPKEEIQYDKTIFQEDITDFSSATTQNITAQASHFDIIYGSSYEFRAICGISGSYKKIQLPTIHINLKRDNELVTSVKSNDIKWSVAGSTEFYRTRVNYDTDGVRDFIGGSKISPAEKTVSSTDALNADKSFNHNVTTAVNDYYKSIVGVDLPSSDFYQKAEYDYETNKTLLTAYFRLETNVRQQTYTIEMPELKVDTVNETDEYYEIALQPVIYAYTFNLASSLCKKNTEYDYYETPRGDGYQITIVPTKINISVNGNTIVLNLNDETKIIGSGKKVFSFDGNELVQTTNTPNAESKYQGVIGEWKNGKQTATKSCPIADYYDENGNKVIDISTSEKMLFNEGDIVIPYTYTNKGDKPLSYNKDFTPKQFVVIGTNISKKQGVMQELTLQEV